MINIDDRLLNELNGFELAVFSHILKRISKDRTSYPSRQLLQKETSFGREKLAKVINSLINKGIISAMQIKENGKFSKTVYSIITEYASIYVKDRNTESRLAENRTTENRTTENRTTGNRLTEKPLTEKQPLSINQYLSINKKEVLKTLSNSKFDFILKSGEFKKYLKDNNLKIESSKKGIVKVNKVILPFQTDSFIKYWNLWKQYKKEQFKFTYKSEISEQTALKKLGNDSEQNESIAIEMIEYSMANGYKGIYKEKSNSYENRNQIKNEKRAEFSNTISREFPNI